MKALLCVIAALALATGCGPRSAGPARVVSVTGAWARASAGAASAGAAYFTIESPRDDRLVGVAVPASVARFAQVHETVRSGPAGELEMRHVEAVRLPAGERVAFTPGQRHVMLLELVRPLAVGDTFDLAIAFQRARPETVRVPVRDE